MYHATHRNAHNEVNKMYPYPKWINDSGDSSKKLAHIITNIAGENGASVPDLSEKIGLKRPTLTAAIRRGRITRICAQSLACLTNDDAIKSELEKFIK